MSPYIERETRLLLPDKVEIGFDTRTAALIDRFLNFLERDDKVTQAQIDALTKRLADSKAKVSAVLVANPDPNPND